ncbi:hypothetical protein A2963_00370 [Candidatus Roizmanbacteria bacterium RIFCSPLOWO2_01_FULL_40_13]|nr:MAG: hypothetical protein A2963_00370 [Candidatus Roizmanbacteria bacterium RIFCSPLOWO2_01_FULL_40_13]
MIVDALRQYRQVENLLPSLLTIIPSILGITLQQAARKTGSILVNNTPQDELTKLIAEAQAAVAAETNAINDGTPLIQEVIIKATLAYSVLGKIQSATKKGNRGKRKKPR